MVSPEFMLTFSPIGAVEYSPGRESGVCG